MDFGADGRGIDVKYSGVHRLHRPERAVDVLGVDRSRQAVFYAVADLDGFIQVAAGDDAQHGAENLFLRDTHAWRDVGEYSGLDEIPVTVLAPVEPMAAQMKRRPVFILAHINVVKDLLNRVFVDHRPDFHIPVQPGPNTQRPGPFGQFIDELFVDSFVNDDPRRRRASLSGGSESAP